MRRPPGATAGPTAPAPTAGRIVRTAEGAARRRGGLQTTAGRRCDVSIANEAVNRPQAPAGFGWHLKRTIQLAAPIIVARAGLVVMFSVDAVMAGSAGELSLGAFGLGAAPMMTVMLICLGALQAAVVLAAQAIGRDEDRAVGAIARAALANGVLFGVLAGLVSLGAEAFFLATGQDPVVSALAADVAEAFSLGLPGLLLFVAVALILEATGRPQVGMLVMIGANLANLLLDGILVLGWFGLVTERGDAVTVMLTSSAVRWGMFAAVFAVLLADARRDGDRHGLLGQAGDWWRSMATLGGAEGRAIRRMGLPMGLGQGVESAAFSSLIFIAGLIDTAALAAHQTAMTMMSLIYMNAVGLAGAASIRVGNAVGRGDGTQALAGWTAIGLGGLASGFCGLAMVAFPEPIARMVVQEPETVAVAAATLSTAGWFTAFDAMMGVAMGALRGLKDVWVPLWLQSGAFWFLAVPLAYVFAIPLAGGAPGLWLGIGAGILTSLTLLGLRFLAVSGQWRAWRARSPRLP